RQRRFPRCPDLRWAVLILALSAMPDAPLHAQARASLDLETALRIASARSPAKQRVDAALAIATGEVRSANAWPNPTLEYRRENLRAPIEPDEFLTAFVPIDVTGRRVHLA